jgi:hypothetical protein
MKLFNCLNTFFVIIFFRSDMEDGELESDSEALNPLVSVTKIDPKEIPEVSNKFLMRAENSSKEGPNNQTSFDRNGDRREKNFGWSKRHVPHSKSGRIIKGRGSFRYRTPSKSRSRSYTPEHWKAAQKNLIKMTEYEKLEEKKKARDIEIQRRIEERKKRHEALARGDGKKSFYELNQIEITTSTHPSEKTVNDPDNALDYEADDSNTEAPEKELALERKSFDNPKVERNRSEHLEYRSKRDNFRFYGRDRYESQHRRSRERKRSRSRSRYVEIFYISSLKIKKIKLFFTDVNHEENEVKDPVHQKKLNTLVKMESLLRAKVLK